MTNVKTKPSILILGDVGYGTPFLARGNLRFSYKDWNALAQVAKSDVIVFTGGTDVNPEFYGQSRNCRTNYPDRERDDIERRVFNLAHQLNKPMAGICRGSQFGCVMSGGSLYQDVTGHAIHGGHPARTYDGEEIYITSTHHQMWRLVNVPHKLLAWSDPRRSLHYLGEAEHFQDAPEVEPEVAWFPTTRFLAAQYHPEYMDEGTSGWKFYQKVLDKYIFNNL